MTYEITKRDKFLEVSVSGETSKFEILEAVAELHRRDPGKTMPDLWLLTAESQVPLHHFRDITEAVQSLLPDGSDPNRTAIVAADAFQKAVVEIYREEAAILPFPIRVFRKRDEAVEWIKDGSDSAVR